MTWRIPSHCEVHSEINSVSGDLDLMMQLSVPDGKVIGMLINGNVLDIDGMEGTNTTQVYRAFQGQTVHFEFPQKVLLRHCDPAGIVFYPRQSEMINDAVEALFRDVFCWPFEEMLQTGGVPTTEFNARFKGPCRHGSQLVLQLTLRRVGWSSLAITTHVTHGEELCFEAGQVLVRVDTDGRPAPWPEQVKDKVNALMETNA